MKIIILAALSACTSKSAQEPCGQDPWKNAGILLYIVLSPLEGTNKRDLFGRW